MTPEHTAIAPPPEHAYRPVRMLRVDVCARIEPIVTQQAGVTERVHFLVTMAGMPVGVAWIEVPAAGLDGAAVADAIWAQLAEEVAGAAQRLGMNPPRGLTDAGIADPTPVPHGCGHVNAHADGPLVSVIIATRNRPRALQACLDAVLASDYRAFEIIVVDNCPSTDETETAMQKRQDDRPVFYVREDRKGLANAHNRGLAIARGEIVAITDDDVIVDRSWLTQIVAGFATAPDIACVTGMILPRALETPAQLQLETYMGYSKGMVPRRYDLREHRPRSVTFPYTIGQVGSGANMAYRTEVLRAMGGFDPALGAGTVARGADDLACFFAVIRAGYGLLYQPSAFVHHEHHRDIATVRRQVYGCGVGYGAFLTKVVAARPWAALSILLRSPLGLARPLRRRSAAAQWASPPRLLVLYEYAGLLVGPFAYVRSRWRARRTSGQRAGEADIVNAPARGKPNPKADLATQFERGDRECLPRA